MIRTPILSAACAAILTAAAPAIADPTPALPFFSKPFPTGYVVRGSSCLERRTVWTPRGWRNRTVDLCGPVLHARD